MTDTPRPAFARPAGPRSTTEAPPRVSVLEWWLTVLTLVLGLCSLVDPAYEYLTLLLGLILAAHLALLIIVVHTTLRTGCLGKATLIVPTIVFFWGDAAVLATAAVPFVPNSIYLGEAQFSAPVLARAFFYVALFELLLLVGYSCRPQLRGILSWTASRVDAPSLQTRRLLYALAALGLLPVLIRFKFDIGAALDRLIESRSTTDDSTTARSASLANLFSYAAMFAAALLFVRTLVKKGARWRSLAVATAVAAPLVLSGTRHVVLYVVMPVLAVAARRSSSRRTAGQGAKMAILVVGTLVVLQAQVVLRPVGFDKLGDIGPSRLLQTDVSGQFTALLFALELVPAHHGYFREPFEPYFLTHFVPRALWSDKPQMRTQQYYDDAYTRGVRGTNYTPTVIGQYHMAWGVLGVAFAGAWLGFLAALADRAFLALQLHRQLAMAAAVGMFYAFIISSFRLYAPFYFAYFAVGLLGAVLATRPARNLRVSASVPEPHGR